MICFALSIPQEEKFNKWRGIHHCVNRVADNMHPITFSFTQADPIRVIAECACGCRVDLTEK